MTAEPIGKGGLLELPTREGEDEKHNLFFRSLDTEPVQTKEQIHGLEGDALVAVDKRMVLRKPVPVGCCQSEQIRSRIVLKPVSGPFQSRLEKITIPKSERTAVGLDLVGVDRKDVGGRQPDGLAHLASSRIAFRYFFAPSA